ncbi:Hint domain-containing protein [Blastochloris tepida]|uniref:Hedgehog/Intein (Hint) domain-containing protein n=1 Tax=Blastochloris tepida TaxID=2233851 RepID=A0A348G230_9HYPH|nr:Hint domain-containing protein [Blastochloris tepida]BBF93613.1 hypothetical protein BLTE_22980 [Blastochloris tepida]
MPIDETDTITPPSYTDGNFSNAYLLTVVGGDFRILDGNIFSRGIDPIATDVVLEDKDQGRHDDPSVLGDVAVDRVTIGGAGPLLNGQYTFVTAATVGTGEGAATGIIVKKGLVYLFLTDDEYQPQAIGDRVLQPIEGEVSLCFMPGTLIRTPAGDVAVETLKTGDAVTTTDGRAVAVRWIGRQTVATRFCDELKLPVRIRAGALGDNLPQRDLLVSGDHALFLDGVLVHAGALVNGTTIVRERDVPAVFTYFHVETEGHELILAEGAAAETFIDNAGRRAFDNFAEFEALYPNGVDLVEMPYPRAKSYRQIPSSLRQRLWAGSAEPDASVAAAA